MASPTPPPNRRLPNNRPNPQGGGQGPGQNQGGNGPGLPRWSIWVLLGLLVLLLFGSRLIPTNNGKEISYGSYLSQVKAGDVAKSNYNNASGRITGETTSGQKFTTSGPTPLPDADQKLIVEKVPDATFKSPSSSWLDTDPALPPASS